MQYRKKPIIVEAEQWFPGKDVSGVFMHQPEDAVIGGKGHGEIRLPQEPYPAVMTAHGQVTRIVPGDWIIAEPDGRGHYPCKPDIFEAIYERVTDDAR